MFKKLLSSGTGMGGPIIEALERGDSSGKVYLFSRLSLEKKRTFPPSGNSG